MYVTSTFAGIRKRLSAGHATGPARTLTAKANSMTRERTLNDVFPFQAYGNGAVFSGFGLRDPKLHVAIDPFLSVDYFRMSAPTFPPHPHAGFSAVTYLFYPLIPRPPSSIAKV